MLRKLIVALCLVSFAPIAVNAQELAAVAARGEASSVQAAPPQAGAAGLLLQVEREPALDLAAAQPQGVAVEKAPAPKAEPRGHSWGNFWEIHFGGYRWLWWAGAAAVLVAIHAGAD